MLILLTSIFLGLIGVIYLVAVKQKNYFRNHDVPFVEFNIPVLGNLWDILTFKKHFSEWLIEAYNSFPEQKFIIIFNKFFGIYQFFQPHIFIKDVELIKQLAVKDFDSLHDHNLIVDEQIDKMFSLGLFTLRGQRWKEMRSTLSPAFTSSKMKNMFNFVSECAENTTNFLIREIEKPENKNTGRIEVEVKDLSTRFTNDTIASAVFGIKVDSCNEPTNFFYEMGKIVTTFDSVTTLKFFASVLMPKVVKFFKLTLFGKKASNFFFGLVNDTMEEREKNSIVRPDMIHLLMEAKKGTLKHETSLDDKDAGFATVEESDIGKTTIKREWTQDELGAQAILFFFAGFETTSTLLCFVIHELAVNPEVQDRLREEIDSIGSKLQYQDLTKMKYMDMVVSETLRKWPPLASVDRICSKPFKLPLVNDSTNLQLTVKTGNAVQFPIYAIHHDPKYFPDPEKFDPERFSDENKGNIHPYAYIPFGVGPRNCIGSRFALMEIKAFVFYLLLRFNFVVIPKTQNPLKMKKTTFNMHAENGFWVGFEPRENKNVQ